MEGDKARRLAVPPAHGNTALGAGKTYRAKGGGAG